GLGLFVFLLFIIAIFYLVIDFQFGFSQSATIGSGLPPLGSGARFFGCDGGSSDIFGIPKDNLATPQDKGLATSTVIDGFR
ncbi:MAG: hypothetical protein IJV81_09680, partial [Paludibacteraceae bacterium]|nr:hypothetical protein [Paludibacteraceae bacterium]